MSSQHKPLEGYRVLDLSTMIAGPFCASILAEFGAEVIKIEEPGKGDAFRRFGTMTEADASMNFLNEARNKKSVTLDLRQEAGASLLKRLVALSDIVVENFRPGTLEKWGLGYDVLKAVKPSIILLRISAYGQTGPKSSSPGYARVAHAFAGLSYLAGEPGRPPVIPGSTSLGDYMSGMYGAIGVLMSVLSRERWGYGQVIDVSLYESIFRVLDELAPVYARTGFVRERMGPDTVNAVPHSHYETEDGRWIAIACSSDKMFARLAYVMDRADFLEPGRFAQVDARVEHRDEINRIVAQWVKSMPMDEVLARLDKGDVPAGPLNSIADIFRDPHFQARKTMVKIQHPRAGEMVVPSIVPRLSETPGSVDTLGPDLGEHNREILGELLGLSQASLDALTREGVI